MGLLIQEEKILKKDGGQGPKKKSVRNTMVVVRVEPELGTIFSNKIN